MICPAHALGDFKLILTSLANCFPQAADAYFDRKFSSTVITSLVTTVPMVVTSRFLASYTFLSPAHAYVQRDDEPVMDTVLRVLKLSAKELATFRSSILALREQLNRKASERLEGILRAAMALPDSGPLPLVNRMAAPQSPAAQ